MGFRPSPEILPNSNPLRAKGRLNIILYIWFAISISLTLFFAAAGALENQA